MCKRKHRSRFKDTDYWTPRCLMKNPTAACEDLLAQYLAEPDKPKFAVVVGRVKCRTEVRYVRRE